VSRADEEVKARELRQVGCSNAITALSAAALAVLTARGGNSQADELVTALRDDIQTMIGDIQALQKIV
jgi:hypothetical protein